MSAFVPLAVVPEDSGGPYVAAAYVVFLVLIAIYVAIMAGRLARLSRQADALEARLASGREQAVPATEVGGASGAGPVQGGVPAPGPVPATEVGGVSGGGPVQGGRPSDGHPGTTTERTPA